MLMFFSAEEIKDFKEVHSYIDIIRHNNISDIKQLSSFWNLSWQTTKNTVMDLISKGFLIEDNESEKYPEKRFRLNNENYFLFGIAVGAAHIKCSLLNLSHEEVLSSNPDNRFSKLWNEICQNVIPVKNEGMDCICFTNGKTFSEIKKICRDIIDSVLDFFNEENSATLLSIGLSLPGIIEKKTNILTFSPNIRSLDYINVYDLLDEEVQDRMRQNNVVFGIFHDTVAATVFEKEFLYCSASRENAYQSKPNLATVYLGTGLGMGLVLQNTLVTHASEFGHVLTEIFSENDLNEIPVCACGHKNCFENILKHKVFQGDISDHALDILVTDNTRYDVFKKCLASFINIIVNVLDVDVLIFSGRVFKRLKRMKNDVEDLKLQYTVKPLAVHCKVLNGSEKATVVASGAAIMSYYKIFNETDDVTIKW